MEGFRTKVVAAVAALLAGAVSGCAVEMAPAEQIGADEAALGYFDADSMRRRLAPCDNAEIIGGPTPLVGDGRYMCVTFECANGFQHTDCTTLYPLL